MERKSNITSITFSGFVEMSKYRYVYFVVMFTVYVLIICSNSIIVYLIIVHKNLHEPMYIFIAALSINSILFSTSIYPKLLSDFLSDKQIIPYSACLFQIFMYYSLACSDFLLLAAMSYDRYVSICKPLHYPTIMRKSTVSICLFVAWLLPVGYMAGGIVLFSLQKLCRFSLKGVFCNSSISGLHCVASQAITLYGVVMLFNTLLFPLFFILFTYAKIFITAHKCNREVRKKAVETCLPHLLVLFSFSCLGIYDVVIVRVESHFPKVVHSLMTMQPVLYNPLFNPVIYGLKMTEILQHLKSFFCHIKRRQY